MNWYYTIVELISFVFIYVMARHVLYRGRFFLHMFQLSGYKLQEYAGWLKKNFASHVIPVDLLALNLVVLVLAVLLDPLLTRTVPVLIIFIFALFWVGSVKSYIKERPKKPMVFTPRMLRLTLICAVLTAVIPLLGMVISFSRGIFFPEIYTLALSWIMTGLLMPFFLVLAALIVWPVERLIQQNFKRKARARLASMPRLKIVAITGSYGKTSTKFFIKTILEERFSVCFTPGSYNTPMGICKVINNDLKPRHQILILEMGARYKGNIAELCKIASPDIAVMTNIGVAHLETFGSVRNIAETKGELLDHIKPGGLAVVNADDPEVMRLAESKKIDKITAGLNNGDFRASEIGYDENGCSFRVTDPDGHSEIIRTRLLGAHNVQNLLLAMGVGRHFGLRLKTMSLAARKIEPVEHRMELKKNDNITVINDAFNSNPVGARNAVETLSKFRSGRRIIITPGMVELGAREKEENERFGEAIGKAGLDRVYLVGPERTRPIVAGIRKSGFDLDRVTVVESLFEANEKMKEDFRPGDVVLYENDLPDTYDE